MFAKKLRVLLVTGDDECLVPKPWLNQFFMRNFTGPGVFDETLVVADGEVEAGHAVRLEEVPVHLQAWLRGRKLVGPKTRVVVR